MLKRGNICKNCPLKLYLYAQAALGLDTRSIHTLRRRWALTPAQSVLGLACSSFLSFRLSYFSLFAAHAPRSIHTLRRRWALTPAQSVLGLACSSFLSFSLPYFSLFAAHAPRSIHTLRRRWALTPAQSVLDLACSSFLSFSLPYFSLFAAHAPRSIGAGRAFCKTFLCWAKKSICLSLAAFL